MQKFQSKKYWIILMQIAQLAIFIIFITGCEKTSIGPQPTNPTNNNNKPQTHGIYIVNEGNYGWGNGSISRYTPSTKEIVNNIFQSINNRPLGDVPQSMTCKDSLGFVVINNTAKIEVVNLYTGKSVASISGFNSPRYCLIVSSTKAYVSELYQKKLWIINPATFQITGSIELDCNIEQMVILNNIVYGINWVNGTSGDGNKLIAINPQTDALAGSITINPQPNSLVIDKNDKLWVATSGNNPGIYRINPVSMNIEKHFDFSGVGAPNSICTNYSGDTLFYLNTHVYALPVIADSRPTQPLISLQSNNAYALTNDPSTGDIYVADAKNFVQQGKVFRFSNKGLPLDEINVDINPGDFLIY